MWATPPQVDRRPRYLRLKVNSNLANGTLILNRLDFYGDQTFAAPALARTTVQR